MPLQSIPRVANATRQYYSLHSHTAHDVKAKRRLAQFVIAGETSTVDLSFVRLAAAQLTPHAYTNP